MIKNKTKYTFNFLYTSLPVTYTYPQENEIKIIKIVSPFVDKLIVWTNMVYLATRACFASYFLANIISFWNLSLLYNLLNISTIPLFLKCFYENLLYNFFSITSIINWINNRIPALKDKFNFAGLLDREHIIEEKNGFGWFGFFGLSS